MDKYKKFINEAMRNRSFNLREFLTRSEGPELFTTVLNDKLFNAYQPELPPDIASIYEEVPLDAGRTIRFPSIRGVNADMVPENSEFQRAEWEITGVEVEPFKFGLLLGMTREMLDHSQLSLIGRQAGLVGMAHKELYRRELMKAMVFFSTGPAGVIGTGVSTGVIGLTDHGFRYPQIGYSNFLSATAMSYEQRISMAFEMLKTQRVTIASKNIDVPFPVIPDTIIAHPTHMIQLRKVLNAGITVVAAGDKGSTNLAGPNILNGMLPNQIFDPECPSGTILIGKAKAGTVVVRQSQLQLDEFENIYFDAKDVRTKEEYLPAIVEDRYWIDVQLSA